MPRSVAVILGLALAASSIGLNTVRYPVVWEMASPMATGDSATAASTTDASAPSNDSSPPTIEPSAEPPKPIAMAAGTPAEDAADHDDRTGAAKTVKNAQSPLEPQRVLVPVTPVSLATGSSGDTGIDAVRRLPPVTGPYADPAGANDSLGRTIRVYPTTGIE